MKLYHTLIKYNLLIIVFFISCKSSFNPLASSEEFKFTNQPNHIYFTILQLNDVYEIAPIQGNKYGGMARVSALYKELQRENSNSMLVLAGDFLNPSLLGTMKIDGERVRGKQMVEVMNAMNFDLVAFGNHEFDLSYNDLQNRLNESHFEWLSANVYHKENGKNHFFHKVIEGKKEAVNETYIQEYSVGGKTVKIGFISVCIPSNPKSYVHYSDMYVEAERTYNELKDKVDVVLGLTHVKIEEDKEIAKLLPGIPLIMGGHEHNNMYVKQGDTYIAKADANAKTVYIHRFEFNPETKELKFKSELKTINDKFPVDEEVNTVVNKWQNLLKLKIRDIIDNPDEIIYRTTEPLDARDTPVRSIQTNMGQIIAESMSKSYGDENIDCAFVNGGSIRIDDILEGDLNAVDIFRVLPYGGPVFRVKLKGELLNKVLNYGENASGTGAYLQRFNVKRNKDGQWLVKDKKIDFNKEYTIATSDYLLKGFDIPFLKNSNPQVLDVYEPNSKEIAVDVRKGVIEFLKSK
ncbi:bifunctional metallophosphatase/5'-nucleotidase [Tenacibaculum jejuense]|uniref:Phosphoesterase/5'-nucleotidase, C-terminal domain protein n=1 Tax=Tenacibaculum jejuense TaxID=584609 RepID=A0A238U9Y3_9FLAO|nr:bifunctional metallophosphatase/5'-nucleotidase [Tenacibaculum jejuense]SNR16013.1 Phosphoesterase/5'-nucleotidase, C-terminal domain protein [Tenacibaculum jejuense]